MENVTDIANIYYYSVCLKQFKKITEKSDDNILPHRQKWIQLNITLYINNCVCLKTKSNQFHNTT